VIRFSRVCAFICMGAVSQIYAQHAPVSGFVVDARSQAIRPINGLPGASLLGQALDLSLNVQVAAFSASGDVAVVADGNQSGQAILVRSLKSTPAVQPLDGALAGVNVIAVNDAGTAAVVYSAASNQLQFLTGLPDNPQASTPLSLSSLPGGVLSLAIAASGTSAVVGVSDGTYGGVYAIASQDGSTPQTLAAANRPTAVLYLNGDQDVAFADASTNQIVVIHNVNSDDTASVLTVAGDNIQNPVGLQAANGTLLAANAGSVNILGYDLATGTVVGDWPLPVAPTRLSGSSLAGVFLVNEPGQAPLYLFSAATASFTFVPVAAQ
jgi:hypothetical protein